MSRDNADTRRKSLRARPALLLAGTLAVVTAGTGMTPAGASAPAPSAEGLVGWATENGGTTGGAGGGTVTVGSAGELTDALTQSGPLVIEVSGTINLSGMNDVGSDKTIVGVGGATITGGGFDINGQSNVIIQNLTFDDWDDDAINVQESSTNIWIDHNTFGTGSDGAVDIKRESDFITVSWNHLDGSDKSMLLGHSDSHTEDQGHLRVTYHHNWFDGSETRHPRVRFGDPVHVFNNYYYDNEYGVASTEGAGVLVEGNYFENCEDPALVGYAGSDPGDLVARDNHLVGSGEIQTAGSVADIPYAYSLDSATSVKDIVTGGAGAN
ncbi:pectate lyase family protein [Streptomyces johnsoniae]|uniref:Right-handed parallel beta-helix repeat-containing protein n=1 Tax=Streptomyces johnsoniae TaxID=3075532 RepID=A0ABU2RWZ4_9ACTN|nr:right-handed parallel beta-helix repeat-containing protein [Streptomyces sp. DSM 41886]MDT0441235.1 right-handed parallel beta-helix repeat-containing protein [Streptomyces sp. DSM 41886]